MFVHSSNNKYGDDRVVQILQQHGLAISINGGVLKWVAKQHKNKFNFIFLHQCKKAVLKH
jgi:hypothetical protein